MIIYWLYPAWEDLDPYYKNTDTGVTFPDDPENSLYINMNLQVSTGDAVIEGAPPPPALDESVVLAEREAEKAAPGSLLAALEVLGTTLDPDTLTSTQIYAAAIVWPNWAPATAYAIGDVANYQTMIYKCVQAHTSQVGWEPPNVPALWALYNPPGETVPWVQPTGAQDAYPLAQRVTHVGFTWQSDLANNVWEPGVYGWTRLAV